MGRVGFELLILGTQGCELTNRHIFLPGSFRRDEMSNIRSECLCECSTMLLNPSFDFIVLVRREVVRVAEHNMSERLVLAHGNDVVQMQSDTDEISGER
jgi:hypothetical protein